MIIKYFFLLCQRENRFWFNLIWKFVYTTIGVTCRVKEWNSGRCYCRTKSRKTCVQKNLFHKHFCSYFFNSVDEMRECGIFSHYGQNYVCAREMSFLEQYVGATPVSPRNAFHNYNVDSEPCIGWREKQELYAHNVITRKLVHHDIKHVFSFTTFYNVKINIFRTVFQFI